MLREIGTLGGPILKVTFDASAMADTLETALGQLEVAVAGVDAARVHVGASQASADAAIVEVDRVAPWIRRYLESLCHLAGEHELARRIRSR